jgi:hypothetical protein
MGRDGQSGVKAEGLPVQYLKLLSQGPHRDITDISQVPEEYIPCKVLERSLKTPFY